LSPDHHHRNEYGQKKENRYTNQDHHLSTEEAKTQLPHLSFDFTFYDLKAKGI